MCVTHARGRVVVCALRQEGGAVTRRFRRADGGMRKEGAARGGAQARHNPTQKNGGWKGSARTRSDVRFHFNHQQHITKKKSTGIGNHGTHSCRVVGQCC